MFIRSVSVLCAAAAVLTVYSADAGAFGLHHRGGKYMTCYKKAVTPPAYKTVAQRVMVRPASCTLYRTPPAYGTTAYEVVMQPSRQVVNTKPPVYGKVQVTKMVRPARTRWTRRHCRGADYRCAVTTPAKYRSRTRRVMIEPRRAWVVTRPAVKAVLHRRVMLHHGRVEQVCQPAVYQTVARQVMVSPGSAQWVPVAQTGHPVSYHQSVASSRGYQHRAPHALK